MEELFYKSIKFYSLKSSFLENRQDWLFGLFHLFGIVMFQMTSNEP